MQALVSRGFLCDCTGPTYWALYQRVLPGDPILQRTGGCWLWAGSCMQAEMGGVKIGFSLHRPLDVAWLSM